VVATMLLASACGESSGPSPVPVNTIAFVQDGDIYTTTLETDAVPRLIAKGLVRPTWSPDGKLLAALRPGDSTALFLMNAVGGSLRQLTKYRAGLDGPTWRPDGQVLGFTLSWRTNYLHGLVMQIDVDGTHEVQLLGNDLYRHPVWSPDGTRFTVEGVYGLIFISTNGPDPFGLADGCCVDWSPDGSDIAYAHSNGQIHLIAPTGTNDRALLDPAARGAEFDPRWSHDGTKIAFLKSDTSVAFPTPVPAIMNADGTGRLILATGLQANSSVEWSFDGGHLAFSAYASEADATAYLARLYVVNSDGSDLHPVGAPGNLCCPVWRP
jgi:Tol biopolymer transport system component